MRGGGPGDEFGRHEEGRRERLRLADLTCCRQALHLNLARHSCHKLCALSQYRVDWLLSAQLQLMTIGPNDLVLTLDVPRFFLFLSIPTAPFTIGDEVLRPLGRLVGHGPREYWRRCHLPRRSPTFDVRFVIGLGINPGSQGLRCRERILRFLRMKTRRSYELIL